MASLLMDMGEEINMEPPFAAFAATQPRSLEARFRLPNTLAFSCDTLDHLVLPERR